MKSILVTGGLGYIGSHTVVELLNIGHNVIVVDNLNNSNIEVKDRIEQITGKRFRFEKVDVRDHQNMLKLLNDSSAEAVIHFAAHKAVGESVEQPLEYYDNNVGGLISLLKAMKQSTCRKIVFSSSCTVYGDTKDLPVTEKSKVVQAASPYGNTKIICEDILRDESATGSIEVVSLRYFNPVGAHESARIGELPLGVPNNLVPFITQTAAGIRDQLTIFGNDYDTEDGTCIRDYIHVSDLAEAHVKALDFIESEHSLFEVFNIGTGRGNSVLEVVETFQQINNTALNYRIGPRRPGDVEQIWADTTKAEQVLAWKAKRELNEMMRSAWEWQKRLKKEAAS
jgi:UDP-glucose 4-epimerase